MRALHCFFAFFEAQVSKNDFPGKETSIFHSFFHNFYLLHQCDFNSFENYVCFVLKNLKLPNHRFFSLASKSIEDLPRIYLNNPGVLPKPKRGKCVVSIMSLIRKFGSFSGIVLVIRHILNFSGWNSP